MAHPHYHGGDNIVCVEDDLDMAVKWVDDRVANLNDKGDDTDGVDPRFVRSHETRDDVIQEIVDEIDSGNAHLMTRNELVEFVAWVTMGEKSGVFTEAVYEMMNSKDPVLEEAFVEGLAKEWFVKKGYENE